MKVEGTHLLDTVPLRSDSSIMMEEYNERFDSYKEYSSEHIKYLYETLVAQQSREPVHRAVFVCVGIIIGSLGTDGVKRIVEKYTQPVLPVPVAVAMAAFCLGCVLSVYSVCAYYNVCKRKEANEEV